MNLKESIEKTIREAIKNVTGITALDEDDSLLDRELNILPANFLYIFDILEEKLKLPVHDIFIDHTYEVMTVKNLTNALLVLETQGYTEEISS
jgi:hypothetical protein